MTNSRRKAAAGGSTMTDESSTESDSRSRTESPVSRRLKSGDESVLNDVLRALGPPVLSVLKRKYGGLLQDGDFEDALATALFRLWHYRKRFDPTQSSLRVWFFRIADNVTRDVLRHGWQKTRQMEVSWEPAALASLTDHHDESPAPVNGSHETTESTLSRELQEILRSLPEAQRRIILADAVSTDGKVPSQDLSNELGIPASTVRVYRRRAIERIRSEMDRRGLNPTSGNQQTSNN